MAEQEWQKVKIRFCDHAGQEVALEAELIYPAEWMPYQPPRIVAHRCSHGLMCSMFNEASCVWAGTNPTFDPFLEDI